MSPRFLVPIALGCVLAFPDQPAAAANPSFDCEGAKHAVEKLICADDELAGLDVEVAKAYAKALSVAPAQQVIRMKSEQTAWRRQLLRCDKSGDERACTLSSYQTRLKQF
jgi:uncharacterized protein